jgi:magnesium transporter
VIKTIYQDTAPGGLHWLDIVYPSKEELEEVARTYALHPNSVEDSLEAFHLPKFEKIGDTFFFILRCHDERLKDEDCHTVQELTRKLAVFLVGNVVITIHRGEMAYLKKFQQTFLADGNNTKESYSLFCGLMHATLATYEPLLNEAEVTMDKYEFVVFEQQRAPIDFMQFYFFKRRVALVRKMLRMSLEITSRLDPHFPRDKHPQLQDVREHVEALFYQADEMINDGQQLMNTYIGIASNRNNDVMRVLTIFSVFFLPLTFIVGIYGMNFEHMPELKHKLGYPFTLGAMGLVVVLIYVWFKRNKWL